MKSRIFIILSATLFYSCGTFNYTSDEMVGTYAQVGQNGVKTCNELRLNKTDFAYIDATDYRKREYNPYLCCDTIAYGNWYLDKRHGVLSLSTPTDLNDVISSDIKEEVKSNSDSVYFA